MKRIIILFIVVNSLQAQNNDFSFDPARSVFRDTIKCAIGSNIRMDDIFVNLSSVDSINVALFSTSKKWLGNIEYSDSLTPLNPHTLLIRFNYIQNTDSVHYLVIYVRARDYFSHKIYTGYDYWIVKPKYPILSPLLEPIYYCESKASFSFATLGLDEDTLYSYQIIDSMSNKPVASGDESTIIFDDFLSDTSFFNKTISIKGFYNGSLFKYKHNSQAERIDSSVWRTHISGPQEENLVARSRIRNVDGTDYLFFEFYYDIAGKIIVPVLNKFSVKISGLKDEIEAEPVGDNKIKINLPIESIPPQTDFIVNIEDNYLTASKILSFPD